MVSHRDLIMYLVAVKSFYRQVGRGEITILNDGSLTVQDRKILSIHLGNPKFVDIRTVDTAGFPRGGCWERLLTILDTVSHCYVVQLDSDTVTRGSVPEVLDCIESNRCFALGTISSFGTRVVPVVEASHIAQDFHDRHVQNTVEKNLINLPSPEQKRYVRASAGFAGFALGLDFRAAAREFSDCMFQLLGQRWTDWGTEQVTSNYLIANSSAPFVLPQPKYGCFGPGQPVSEASFLHFIGSDRHVRGIYASESRAIIKAQL